MADKKITQLTNITGANLVDADEFVVVDISADETKAITLGELKEAFDSGSGFVRITGDTMTGALDVQSTITADDLIVDDDTATITIKSFQPRLILDDDSAVGAGSDKLIIQSASAQSAGDYEFVINNDQTSSTDQVAIKISGNGDISFYENTGITPKLTWSASEEMLTTSGLTVDGDAEVSSNVPVFNFMQSDGTNQNAQLRLNSNSFYINQLSDDKTSNRPVALFNIGTGDISFYDSQGSSQSFFWDADAESLGIGTSSPSDALHVYNTSSLDHVRIDGPAGINRNLNFSTSGSTRWNIYANSTAESGSNSGSNLTISKYTDAGVYNGVAMFIERSSGSVGIGTSSPASLVTGGSSPVLSIGGTDSGLTNGEKAGSLSFITNDGSYIGTYSDGITGEIASIAETAVGGGYGLAFYTGVTTGSNRAERVRIDMTGNVGIGTSSPATALDVTGTITSEGLTVSNPTGSLLKLESTGAGLGAGSVIGDIQFYGNDASFPGAGIKAGIKVETVASLGDDAQMKFTTSDGTTNNIDRMLIANNGEISFYENTGTTPKFFWDASAQSLSLGDTLVTALQTPLRVKSNSSDFAICIEENSGGETWQIGVDVDGDLGFYNSGSATASFTFDDSGNLLVGKTATGISTVGTTLFEDGTAYHTVDDNVTMRLNRLTDDGTIIDLLKDGNVVGSIGTNTGQLYIGYDNGAQDVGILFGDNTVNSRSIIPCRVDGSIVDGGVDIGDDSGRWRNLYLSGGVYLGGTGAANKLDDYEFGTFTPVVADAASGGNESSSTAYGYYVKVGQLVYVHFNVSNIDTTGLTSGSDVYITGLPFTSNSVTGNAKYTGTAHMSVVTFDGIPLLDLNESSTVVRVGEVRSGAGFDYVTVSQLSSSASDIHGNLCYQTSS